MSRTTATRLDWRIHHGGCDLKRLAGLGVGLSVWHCRVWLGPVLTNGYNPITKEYNSIGEYTTSGAVVNASLVTTGLESPGGIAVSGSDLL